MIGNSTTTRRQLRMATILEAAWKLAESNGIGGLSLHGLAREVGIRQPSLYAYFDSKNGLYDAMFADGNRQLLERLDRLALPADPRSAVKMFMGTFLSFAVEDPARCALLLQRPIPGFAPSPESYALAEVVLGRIVALLRTAGARRPGRYRLRHRHGRGPDRCPDQQ